MHLDSRPGASRKEGMGKNNAFSIEREIVSMISSAENYYFELNILIIISSNISKIKFQSFVPKSF